MRCFLGIGAAATAAVMVCAAAIGGVGCGGSTFTAGSDAGSDGHGGSGSGSGGGSSSGGSGGSSSGSGSGGGSGSGSSSGGASSPCPPSAPTGGNACMPNGVRCEYGTSPDPSCNQLFDCLNGTWASGGPGGANCPVGVCPAHYSDVPDGQVCAQTGLDCAYAEGECNCSFSGPGGTGVMPTWHCFRPQGCPEPRPRLGSACTQEGQSCDYGACTGGVEVTCTSGYWQWTMTPCPG